MRRFAIGGSLESFLSLSLSLSLLIKSFRFIVLTHAPTFSNLFLFFQSEDEVVDPTPAIREECRKTCPKQQDLYKACIGRITAKGEGDCEAWFLDLMTCMDKCVAPKLFKATKE